MELESELKMLVMLVELKMELMLGPPIATTDINDEVGVEEESTTIEEEIDAKDSTEGVPQESIIEEEFTNIEWLYFFFLSLLLSRLSLILSKFGQFNLDFIVVYRIWIILWWLIFMGFNFVVMYAFSFILFLFLS